MQIGSDAATGAQRPSQPAGQRYRMLICNGSTARTEVLTGRRWTLGRGAECDIRLPGPACAIGQVLLEADGRGLAFRVNGTGRPLLDGRPCQRGRLEAGSTLLIGTTRLTAEPIGRKARVRVVSDPRYSLPGRFATPSARAKPAPALDPELTERLVELVGTARNADDFALRALETTMSTLARDMGMLARIADSEVVVLASASRKTGAAELRIPRQLIHRAREERKPWTLGEPGKRGTRREQLVVPLGDGDGILLLAEPRADAPDTAASLGLAQFLGTFCWRRLAEVRERDVLNASIEALRSQRGSGDPVHLTRRLQPLRSKLRRAARQTAPVFLIGERGTEKEDLARYVHEKSAHRDGPFLFVHGSVLPAGSATRAHLESLCEGDTLGSVFIEDPDELDPNQQKLLATLLRDGRITHRIVSSSTLTPEEGVSQGRLSEELAEQLGTVRLQIPPLRSAPAEIVPLAELLLAALGDGEAPKLTDGAKQCLVRYKWPGNVEELRAALRVAAASSRAGRIAPRQLPEEVRTDAGTPEIAPLSVVEKRHILHVLEVFNGAKRPAAQALGIASSTLYEKLKRIDQDDLEKE